MTDAQYPEVVQIAQRLIRFNTSNNGQVEPGTPIETEAARYVQGLLEEVGYQPEWIEVTPGRPNLVLRVPGQDRERPGLVLHGHLDVVPAVASDWERDPFGGEIMAGADGESVLWGRGAVDMKDMVAMIIALLRDMARSGYKPARDLVVCFFADEEAGGYHGAQAVIRERPELFEGCTQAVSEVGGYPAYVNGKRVYLIQTGEKGQIWYKLHARGKAGHGSQVNRDNAVTAMARALAAIGSEPWPVTLTPTVRALLEGVAEVTGLPFDVEDPETLEALVEQLGSAKAFVGATLAVTSNPTQMEGGYMVNVIPESASGGVDVRFLPGTGEDVRLRLKELADGVELEPLLDIEAIEADAQAPIMAAMEQALKEADPDCIVLPYLLSAGTDNKHLAKLGIEGYGFVPVSLPPNFDFPAMFHAANERIPVQSLIDGLSVLKRFIELC